MLEKIKEIIINNAENLGDVEITEGTDLVADLGLTSLDIVNCISDAEDAFGKEVPDEALENIKTVGDILKLLA